MDALFKLSSPKGGDPSASTDPLARKSLRLQCQGALRTTILVEGGGERLAQQMRRLACCSFVLWARSPPSWLAMSTWLAQWKGVATQLWVPLSRAAVAPRRCSRLLLRAGSPRLQLAPASWWCCLLAFAVGQVLDQPRCGRVAPPGDSCALRLAGLGSDDAKRPCVAVLCSARATATAGVSQAGPAVGDGAPHVRRGHRPGGRHLSSGALICWDQLRVATEALRRDARHVQAAATGPGPSERDVSEDKHGASTHFTL